MPETAPMTPRRITALAAAASLAGCGDFPQLDDTVSDAAMRSGYPALVPVEDLRAAAARRAPSEGAAMEGASTDAAPAVDARAARLRARAASLRGEVVDAETKQRLTETIELDEDDI